MSGLKKRRMQTSIVENQFLCKFSKELGDTIRGYENAGAEDIRIQYSPFFDKNTSDIFYTALVTCYTWEAND